MPRASIILALLTLFGSQCTFAAPTAFNGSLVFNPNCTDNFVTSWGQNRIHNYAGGAYSSMNEPSLSDYCNDDLYDVINLQLISTYSQQATFGLPIINLANHCGDHFAAPYTTILNCTNLAADITKCQARGKVVMLSVSGASVNGTFETLGTSTTANQVAYYIWNMFLGGSSPRRPFGSAKLDGVDISIKGGSPNYWSTFANSLRNYSLSDTSKYYYVAASTGCVYPDPMMGPNDGGSVLNNTLLSTSVLDWVNLEFFNHPGTTCGNQYYNTINFPFAAWANWAPVSNRTKLILGGLTLPSVNNGSDSYITPDSFSSILADLQTLYDYQFGGASLWDASITNASLFNQSQVDAYGNSLGNVQVNFAQFVDYSFRFNRFNNRQCGDLPDYAKPAPVYRTATPTTAMPTATATATTTTTSRSTTTAKPAPTAMNAADTFNSMIQKTGVYFTAHPTVPKLMILGAAAIVVGAGMFTVWRVRLSMLAKNEADVLGSAAGL